MKDLNEKDLVIISASLKAHTEGLKKSVHNLINKASDTRRKKHERINFFEKATEYAVEVINIMETTAKVDNMLSMKKAEKAMQTHMSILSRVLPFALPLFPIMARMK